MQRLTRWAILFAPVAAIATGAIQFSGLGTRAGAALPTVFDPNPTTDTTAAPTTQPIAKAMPATTQISFNFDQASVDAVLDHLSSVAGFIILKPDGPLDFRVSIVSKQPVTPDEAVSMLNSELKGHGYTARQMGRILKIVAIDKAKKGDLPVHFGADPAQIADTDELITQVIPVRSVDAVKLKTDLQPLIDTNQADLSANAGSNSIIITDTSSSIKRIVEIIANLDKHDAMTSAIRVKQLKYADATAAAKLITDLFNPPTQQTGNNNGFPFPFGGGGGGRFRFGGGGGGQGGPGGGQNGGNNAQSEDAGNTGKVLASSDTRTNTVVVTGPPDTLSIIDQVLTQLDSDPAEQQSFFLYAVKNGQAVDMQATLNSLFTGNTSSNNNRSTTANRTTTVGSGSTSSFGGASSGFGGSSSRGGGGGGGAFGSSGSSTFGTTNNNNTNRNQTQGPSGTSGTSGAISDLIGQVYVVADQDTNSLLVATSSKYEDRVRAIIQQLDRPVAQVLIKVLIAEVTHNNSDDLGLDFSVLNTRASGNGQSIVSSFGDAAAQASNGGLAVSLLESNVTATLHALTVANKLDVLSRPYILATDNQTATMSVGQYVPIVTDSRIDENDNTINTIQYEQIGISLSVIPHVNPEGLVQLNVQPQISSLTDTTVQVSSGVTAPVYQQRTAQTLVSIRDGQTVVIGGLMQDQKTSELQKTPILGSIPLIGLLFQRNQVTKVKTELLIFMTPHVAMQPGTLKPMSEDEMKGLKLTPSAVEPGVFDEHMRGMQRGTTQPSLDYTPGANQPAPTTPPPLRN